MQLHPLKIYPFSVYYILGVFWQWLNDSTLVSNICPPVINAIPYQAWSRISKVNRKQNLIFQILLEIRNEF